MRSKKLKKSEIDKTLQSLPMYEQVIAKLNRCKKLREDVFADEKKKLMLKESAGKLSAVQAAYQEKYKLHSTKSSEYDVINGQNF